MNIRLATTADVPAISGLCTEFFTYNAQQQPEYFVADRETGSYPTSVINSDKSDFIVAVIDDKIVGFAHVEENETPPYPSLKPHKFACVAALFINQQYRKKGIGKLLLEKVKHWAKSRNLEYIELFVLENNGGGKRFYAREHFTTASRTMRLKV